MGRCLDQLHRDGRTKKFIDRHPFSARPPLCHWPHNTLATPLSAGSSDRVEIGKCKQKQTRVHHQGLHQTTQCIQHLNFIYSHIIWQLLPYQFIRFRVCFYLISVLGIPEGDQRCTNFDKNFCVAACLSFPFLIKWSTKSFKFIVAKWSPCSRIYSSTYMQL